MRFVGIIRKKIGVKNFKLQIPPRRPEPDSSDPTLCRGIRHLLRFRNPETCPERSNADLSPKSYCVRDGVDFRVRAVCPFRPNTVRRLCVRRSFAPAGDGNAVKGSRYAVSHPRTGWLFSTVRLFNSLFIFTNTIERRTLVGRNAPEKNGKRGGQLTD